MPFVIDASIVLDWAFEERRAEAEIAANRIKTEGAIAPIIWWYEVRNVLLVGERRGRLTAPDMSRILADIARLSVVMDALPDEASVVGLARRHRLTFYDAAYLELAVRERLPLATLDRSLADAARAEGVPLVSDDPA